MKTRFVKILKISQSHLAPGMNRDKLQDLLDRRMIYQPINWDRISDQELDQMVQEILDVVTAHRAGVL